MDIHKVGSEPIAGLLASMLGMLISIVDTTSIMQTILLSSIGVFVGWFWSLAKKRFHKYLQDRKSKKRK